MLMHRSEFIGFPDNSSWTIRRDEFSCDELSGNRLLLHTCRLVHVRVWMHTISSGATCAPGRVRANRSRHFSPTFVAIITVAFFAHWTCSLISMQWCCCICGNVGECRSLTSFCGRMRFPLFLCFFLVVYRHNS